MATQTARSERRTWFELLAAISAFALLVGACAASNATVTPGASQSVLPISDPNAAPTAFGCHGGVLAVDVRRAGAVLAQASSACTTMPIASGSPWPISAKQAANAFRSFVGLPDVAFEVNGPYDNATDRSYSVSSHGPINVPRYFGVGGAVDATTGEVLSVAYVAHTAGDPGPQAIDARAAQLTAADYLRAHGVDVSTLTVSTAPTDSGWEFTWERMDGEVGLPPRVTVTVDWQYGDIASFRRLAASPNLGVRPDAQISRQQAEALALASTWLTSPKVEASRLRYVDWGVQGMKLMWEIYVSGAGDGPSPTYFEYSFDAITGELS